MTEEEWLRRGDPSLMLDCLKDKVGARKLRLFSVGCCNRLSHLITEDSTRNALSCAERFADRNATSRERREQYARINGCADEFTPELAVQSALSRHAFNCAQDTSSWAALATGFAADSAAVNVYHFQFGLETRNAEFVQQSNLLRDIFGNPFRPVAADPAWLTPTVQSIAAAIYEDRAFDRLPILADALEEAGCTDADMLLHCRQPADHVRGCWVVDLVLGKT